MSLTIEHNVEGLQFRSIGCEVSLEGKYLKVSATQLNMQLHVRNNGCFLTAKLLSFRSPPGTKQTLVAL